MRNLINLISLAQADILNEDIGAARRDGGPNSPNGFLRINSIMHQIAGSTPDSEDGATVLLQRLNYLCDAISEFGQRRGGDLQRKMDDAVTHLRGFFPRDGDIEGALHNADTMKDIRDGLAFLRTQLRSDGVMVEAEEEPQGQLYTRCEQCGANLAHPSRHPKCTQCTDENEDQVA